MKKDFVLAKADFENLLSWLSTDREQAGVKYEEIRKGLINFFRYRGCSDPETLADETINRVATKVSGFDLSNQLKTITYFYGFASKVYLESISLTKKKEVQLEPNLILRHWKEKDADVDVDKEYDCLESCLAKLPTDERAMIVLYYSEVKSAKFELRKKIARDINSKPGALHTKVHRIRNTLKKCIEACIKKNNL